MSFYSTISYTSDGINKIYSIPFSYLDESHIKVIVNSVVQGVGAYTFPTQTTIEITAQPPAGQVVTIRRVTPATTRFVDFQNAATLTESDLDLNSDQLFYIMQESLDANVNSWITQAAFDSIIAAQAVCLGYIDDCEDQVDLAASQVTLATAQQEKAQKWAEEVEDTPVETGKYSALHWAAKAHAWAGGALQSVITGAVLDFAGAVVPEGYLLCDGAAVDRTTYADLFAAIGVAWGEGNGTTTFNLPDLRDKFTIGASATKALASEGGAESVALTTAHLPSHTHDITMGSSGAHTHGISTKVNTGSISVLPAKVTTSTQALAYTESSGSHTHTLIMGMSQGGTVSVPILPPYAAVKKIIKT